GTYVFLTDDSEADFFNGKPATNVFNVQFLNSLLERIIKEMVVVNGCNEQAAVEISQNIPANIGNIVISPNPVQGTITIESKDHLKEIFIADFTGKILLRLETGEKQNKWTANLSAYPNATFLIKYITTDDRWGAEKFVLNH
ncbi:MAG: T9SS type A sorting domain-containing protein, partial [Chitinophagales bacterium]